MNKNPFSNIGFSTSQKRHNMIVFAILLVGIPGLILCSVLVVQKDSDSKVAVDLLESGLVLLSEGDIDEGLNRLELAESKSKTICNLRTDNYVSEEEADINDMTYDQKLTRLKGIRHLRSDSWVDDEIIKILTVQKRFDEIQNIYRKRMKPWNEERNVLSSYDEAPPDVKVAQLMWDQGKKAQAAKELERTVTLFPWNNSTRDLAAKVFKEQKPSDKLKAVSQLTLSDDDLRILQETTWASNDDKQRLEQVSKLDKLIAKYPTCALAILNRSELQLQLKHYDKAVADAATVIKMYPWLPEGYCARAAVNSELDKNKECLSDYSAALKLMPYSEALLVHRIGVATSLSAHDQVLRDQDTLIALEPDDIDRREGKAAYLESLGKYKQAERVIDEALPMAVNKKRMDDLLGRNMWQIPNDPTKVDLLTQKKADLRMHQNDTKGALEIVSKLIEQNKERISNYDFQSDLLLQAGDKMGALAALNRAIDLTGDPFIVEGLTPTFLTGGKLTALPDKLTPGSRLKPLVLERMEKRATIYDAIGDHAAALKERREKLKVMKLELQVATDARCLDVIDLAAEFDDADTAVYAAAQFYKGNSNIDDYSSIENKCEKLADSKHRKTALATIREFDNDYPGRERIKAALAKAMAQSGTMTD